MIYLLATIFALACIRGADKAILYGAFAAFMIINNEVEQYISDDSFAWYYLFDALLLYVLSDTFEYSRKHAIYHLILGAGIAINGIGYLLWYNCFPHDLYNLASLGLYSFIIIILMSGQAYDSGNSRALCFFDRICSFIDKNYCQYLAKT